MNPNNVENNVLIIFVVLMCVAKPVGALHMQLDVANPFCVVDCVVMMTDQKEIAFSDVTEVSFHELTQEQIHHYVKHYKPLDKAGAYAIQEWIGVTGIKSINGDFYNVMGLPVSRVVKELNNL